MQEIGAQIADFMKEFTKIIRQDNCSKCGNDFNVIAHLDKEKEVRAIADECPYCKKEREDEELKREIQETVRRSRMNKYNWLSVLPFDLEDATFENYKPKNETQEKLLETSQEFVDEKMKQTTLFFQGDTGLGKTHLANCIFNSFKNKIKPCIFLDLPSLLSMIRDSYGDYTKPSQEKILESIKKCELLILDDIGAEYVKPDASGFESWAADILFQIVNSRQGKKNVYTTNFTSKYLNQKYGMMSKRIISRLMSNAKVIKVEGEDHRLKGLE